MSKMLLPLLISALFQTNLCLAAPLTAFDEAARLGGAAADAVAAPAPAPSRAGSDLTAGYLRLLSSPGQGLGEKETAELRGCRVLLVRGFMTGGYVEPISIFGRKVWIGRYFHDQMKALKELGVDYAMADVDSVMLPAHNAAKIAAEIRKSDKPVILITHSDGGMYALQALVENPDLASGVRGFISLQTPFGGSPVADYVKGHRLLSAAMSGLLGHFGGTIDALDSLTPDKRSAFQAANREAINSVVAGVRIISFASWKADRHGKPDTLLELPRNLMLTRGMENDGLVPAESAILPGSDYVKVEGADHIVTVMAEDTLVKFDRRAFTRALLSLIITGGK